MLKGKMLALLMSGILLASVNPITSIPESSYEKDTPTLFEEEYLSSQDISSFDPLNTGETSDESIDLKVDEKTSESEEESSTHIDKIADESDRDIGGHEGIETQEPKVSARAVKNQGIKEVSTWDEFKDAVTNIQITDVHVIADLDANNAGPEIKHDLNIEFNGHTLNIRGRFITVSNPASIIVNDIKFTGTSGGRLFNGDGKVTLKGTVSSLMGNEAGIAALSSGTLVFDGVNLTYDRAKRDTAAIVVKYFSIINQSLVHSEAIKFYSNKSSSSAGNSVIIIDDKSNVTTNSTKNSSNGQVWELERTATFSIKGASTLKMKGDISRTGEEGGLFIINGNATYLNVLEGSAFISHSKNSPAVLLQSVGGQFNVSDGSYLKLRSDGQGNTLGATLRFRLLGDMTFNVTDKSKIDIEKTAGNAPAIRMYGGNNKINVSGASEFIVKNAGNGRPENPGGDGDNQGIQYKSGHNNEFNLLDEDSSVFIDAENGAAIDAGSQGININAGEGTFFTARGNTASTTRGIFNGGALTFSMTAPKYFDFRNDAGGYIFETDRSASFSSTSSDLAVWGKIANLDGDPTCRWDLLDFSMSGTNFGTLNSTTNPTMEAEFGAVTNYSRMSANNQTAIIDELRVPTNADKYIYAHAMVPEARGELRDAHTDEVLIKVGIYDEMNNEISQLEGKSIGDPISVYGDEARAGLFKIDAPNKDFLPENYSIKVLEAWRGVYSDRWVHQSKPEDIFSEQLKTFDVMPPKTAILDKIGLTVSPSTKEVSGKGEPGANVYVYLNGKKTDKEAVVNPDGTFVVAMPNKMVKNDIVEIYLQDTSGIAQVIKPPVTNSQIGNIQSREELAYHDAVFVPSLKLTVTGSLKFVSAPKLLDFGSQKVSNVVKEYSPVIDGDLIVSDERGDEKQEWRITLKETSALATDYFSLAGSIFYQNETENLNITDIATVVEERKLTEDGEINLSEEWINDKGINLKVPIEKQLVGTYNGVLTWTLEDVPNN